MNSAKSGTHATRPRPLVARPRPLWCRTARAHQKGDLQRDLQKRLRLMEKLLPLVKWYGIGSALVVTGTAFLTWIRADMAGQNNLLILFLATMLMLVFLFCIPLAIMNYTSKDYLFTAAVSILAFFMLQAHVTVMDTLGVENIQIQICMIFLGVYSCIMFITYINIINIKTSIKKISDKFGVQILFIIITIIIFMYFIKVFGFSYKEFLNELINTIFLINR